MSHIQTLNTQTSKINVVVNVGKKIDTSLFKMFFDEYCSTYAFIVHDKDHMENGEVKPIHYHFVANLKEMYNRLRLSTTLSKLADMLKLKSRDGVQIERYNSFEASLQYLTHKNQPNKHQYDVSSIITNLSKADFDLYYNVDIEKPFTFDFIYSTCKTCNNKKEVICNLWSYYSKSYANQRLINDIWDCVQKERRSGFYYHNETAFDDMYYHLKKLVDLYKHNAIQQRDIDEIECVIGLIETRNV